MEDMKLFQVTLLIISLIFLSNCGVPPKQVNYNKNILNKDFMIEPSYKKTEGQFTDMLYGWNDRQFISFRFWNLTGFKSDEKKQHKDAVYYALNNAEDFEIISWYSKTRVASGKVRIIFTHPVNAGMCRDYQVQLQIKKNIKSKTLTACKMIGMQTWIFRYWDDPGDEIYFN